MKTSDEKLDQILKSGNTIPFGNPDNHTVRCADSRVSLAQRIIAQADPHFHDQTQRAMPVEVEESIVKQVIRRFIFPKPAYALAFSMVIGVLLGWQNPDVANPSVENGLQVASIDEDLSRLFLSEVVYYE